MPAGWPGDQACANVTSCVLLSSSRDTASMSNQWSAAVPTSIPDLGSNLNAGSLADGSVFLVWNGVPRPSVNDTLCSRMSPVRNPLTLALSRDGTVFEKAWALYNNTRPKRYCGSAKPFGPSYPQARHVSGEGGPSVRVCLVGLCADLDLSFFLCLGGSCAHKWWVCSDAGWAVDGVLYQ